MRHNLVCLYLCGNVIGHGGNELGGGTPQQGLSDQVLLGDSATFLPGIDQGPLGTGSSDLSDIFLWLGLTGAEDIDASVSCLEDTEARD